MLVLQRKVGEVIRIGHGIQIVVCEIRGDAVRLGIEAPRDVPVHRDETYRRMQARGDVKSLADDTAAT